MQESGRLIFRVFTSEASLPVEGATVLVRLQEPPGTIQGVRVTNSSGETDPITVLTPGAVLSQSPEKTIRPWTGLCALVEHPGYERVSLTGLQIFPGIETIQSIGLIPLREFDAGSSGQVDYQFTPQPVWEGAVE